MRWCTQHRRWVGGGGDVPSVGRSDTEGVEVNRCARRVRWGLRRGAVHLARTLVIGRWGGALGAVLGCRLWGGGTVRSARLSDAWGGVPGPDGLCGDMGVRTAWGCAS